MTALLFSGGWDSAACFYLEKKRGESPHLLFVDYGQIYERNERHAADEFAKRNDAFIAHAHLGLVHDQDRRNFFLLAEAKRLGYDTVICGSRNILPWFDKYRDSNWLSLKLFSILMNVRVRLPVVAWPKRRIVHYVRQNYSGPIYNCYLAKDDFRLCPCPNCAEQREIHSS